MNILEKLLLPVFFVVTSLSFGFSQDYKMIEWDVLGASVLFPVSMYNSETIGFTTEARFNINNKLSVGVNYNWQFFARNYGEVLRGLGVSNSYGLTGDYYLKNNLNKRAFVGLVIGIFDNEARTGSGIEVGGKGLAITPRVGYEFYFLRFTAEYNHTFHESSPSYFALGASINIGGRHKS